MNNCTKIVIIMMLCLLLCGCANDVASQNNDISQKPNAPVLQDGYVPSQDLIVLITYVDDYYTYVVLENRSDLPILDCELALIEYDKNGFSEITTDTGYKAKKIKAINLMAGSKTALRFETLGIKSAATVSKITFSDQTTWEQKNLDLWVKDNSVFSEGAYQTSLKALLQVAKLAEHPDVAQLIDYCITDRYGDQVLSLKFINTGTKAVKTASFFVLEYDAEGQPIDLVRGGYLCSNGSWGFLDENCNLAPDEFLEEDCARYLDDDTDHIKLVVHEIQYADDTYWENPYWIEWVISNAESSS